MSIIQEFVDKYEYIGLDECYADVTLQTRGDYLEAEKIAISIKEKIRNGIGITCSIGVAPNKLLAKIASDIKKPDGLTLVRMENVGEFLKKCNLEQIPGIGPKTIKKLNKIKINSLCDLANADLFLLVKEFGRRTGTYIHNASKGIDNQNIKESKPFQKQLGKIVTLKTDATRSDQMDPEIMYMSRQLCAQAKAQNISFKNIAITLILRDLKMISKSKSMKSYVNDSDNVYIVCRELLDDLFDKSDVELVVRRIGIRLGDLKENIGQNTILDFIKQD
jgi:DNA polymerase IV (DinB-like DNA polymerase)